MCLAGSVFKFAVVERVIVPNGTGTFLQVRQTSTMTTTAVLFVEPVPLAGGNASFRVALWGRPEVLCGKNISTEQEPDKSPKSILCCMGTNVVGSGASEIVLYLATVVLVDGASVFIASDTGAVAVSPPGGVASVNPLIFSVVALDSEEPTRTSCFLTSVSRAMSPAKWRSTLMKELWRLPAGAR